MVVSFVGIKFSVILLTLGLEIGDIFDDWGLWASESRHPPVQPTANHKQAFLVQPTANNWLNNLKPSTGDQLNIHFKR